MSVCTPSLGPSGSSRPERLEEEIERDEREYERKRSMYTLQWMKGHQTRSIDAYLCMDLDIPLGQSCTSLETLTPIEKQDRGKLQG